MKLPLKKLLTLSICLILLSLETSCKDVQIADQPQQSDQAMMVARKYITAFLNSDRETVITLSNFPFWADGTKLNTLSHLQKELLNEMDPERNRDIKLVEISDMQMFKTSEIRLLKPDIWEKLSKNGFGEGTYFIAAKIVMKKEHKQGSEVGYLILKPDENGQWKVVGIED